MGVDVGSIAWRCTRNECALSSSPESWLQISNLHQWLLIIATIKETISSLSLLSLTCNFAKLVGIVADFIVINDLNAEEEKILQSVQCLMTFPISYTAITLLANCIQLSFRKEE